MILSHEHQFVYIANGRTGTTSIEAALSPYHQGQAHENHVRGLYAGKHVTPGVVRAQLGPEVWEKYFVFCFVRNPWDWLVSQFFWNIGPSSIDWTNALSAPISTLRKYRAQRKAKSRVSDLDTFSSSDIREIYTLLRQYRAVYQADSLFQYHYVYAPGGEKLVDFVGRFETVGDDFQKAADRIGLDDVELPHKNTTTHRDYRTYYTDDLLHR